jgi:hypothetical protein
LANILFATVGHHTVEGVAHIAAVAVHLGIDVNSVVGGSGFKVFSRLNVWAHTAILLATLLHARYSPFGPGISLWWNLGFFISWSTAWNGGNKRHLLSKSILNSEKIYFITFGEKVQTQIMISQRF